MHTGVSAKPEVLLKIVLSISAYRLENIFSTKYLFLFFYFFAIIFSGPTRREGWDSWGKSCSHKGRCVLWCCRGTAEKAEWRPDWHLSVPIFRQKMCVIELILKCVFLKCLVYFLKKPSYFLCMILMNFIHLKWFWLIPFNFPIGLWFFQLSMAYF